MKSRISSSSKQCGNCDCWTGLRNLDSTRHYAEIESNTYGDCLEGGRKVTHKFYTATCSKWKKWGVLK